MTTEQRLKDFKQVLLDAIDECYDENIYEKNCPDEEYDYEANEEDPPEDIDLDEIYDEKEGLTLRQTMVKMATYGFPEGWDYIYNKEKSDSEAKYEDWRYHNQGLTNLTTLMI